MLLEQYVINASVFYRNST